MNWRQTSQEDADRGDEEPGLCAGDGGFEILGQPATTVEKSKGSLDRPASGQQGKSLDRVGSLDDFHFPAAVAGERFFQLGSGVAAISEDVAQPPQQRADRYQQRRRAVSVLDIGGMHLSGNQATIGIGQDVPFAALHLFAGIIAPEACNISGVGRLAVDNTSCGAGFAPGRFARRHHQMVVDPAQRAVVAPTVKIALNRRDRRKLTRQRPPLATGLGNIQDRVQHTLQVGLSRSAKPVSERHERRQCGPLRVCQTVCAGRRPPAILAPGGCIPSHRDLRRCFATTTESRRTVSTQPPSAIFGSGSEFSGGCYVPDVQFPVGHSPKSTIAKRTVSYI